MTEYASAVGVFRVWNAMERDMERDRTKNGVVFSQCFYWLERDGTRWNAIKHKRDFLTRTRTHVYRCNGVDRVPVRSR
jgi:hypothetical protein